MKLYAYCLSDEVTAHMIESVTGVMGALSCLVQFGEIKAVVSEFDGERAEVTRENVLAHEGIVRRVLAETTPLPFRFGTVVSETQLQSYLNSHHASLKAQLEHVRGCVEMSVKVIWNVESVRQEAARPHAPDEMDGEPGQMMRGIGTAFLVAKRREILGDEMLKERAAEIAAWLAERLGDTVREARVNVQPTEALVVAASHLVERARLEDYRAVLRSARRERSELHFLTSGAWPPYSFTDINS